MQPKKTLASLIFTVTLVSSAITPTLAAASGWVDDWVDQKSVTGPSYYEGQKRNYYTAGSLSARWQTANDHPFTLTSPRLRSGCGGIDMFMGGFSFLNVDYLVEKLQRILAAAPAAAFDIALKTLAPQVAETIKTLEAIVDRLNNLAIDDCKAAKGLVATIADNSGLLNDKMSAEMKSAQSDFMVSSGIEGMWTDVSKKFDSLQTTWTTGTPPPANNDISNSAKASIQGCPTDIKDVFGGGAILANAGVKMGLNDGYVDMIRGLIGDLRVTTPDQTGTTFSSKEIPPCGENANKELDAILNGTAYKRPADGGACTPVTDTNANLYQYVNNQLNAIAVKIKTKTPLEANETNFVNSTPVPVTLILRSAVASKTESVMIPQMSVIIAKGYAFYLLADLYGKAGQIYHYARLIGTGAVAAKDCQIAQLADPLNKFSMFDSRLNRIVQAAQADYANALQENQAVLTFAMQMKQFDDQVQAEIAARFGGGQKPAFMRRL